MKPAITFLALIIVMSAATVLRAHDVLYPGTVLAIEPERLQVKTVDPDSKADVTLWFTVTKETQVKRGDRLVTYPEAKVQKDERIVVVVNHEEMGSETTAKELRLAARSEWR